MYTLNVRYGALTDFLSALQLGSSMTETLTSAMLDSNAFEDTPGFAAALEQKGLSLADVKQAGQAIRQGDQRTARALVPFKTALAHAGVFPPGHIMATGPDQLIELVVDAEATRELFAVASTVAQQLRAMAQGPPAERVGEKAPAFPLMFLFAGPSDKLAATAPEVLQAVLAAGAPLL